MDGPVSTFPTRVCTPTAGLPETKVPEGRRRADLPKEKEILSISDPPQT